jgi:hypothetical protein
LKANRPATFEDVGTPFAEPPPGSIATCTTTDGDHGRIEVRRHEVGRPLSDRRHPGEPAFPGLAMPGTVEGGTGRHGEVALERRYHLGSARLDAAALARAVRGHRGIENRPHRAPDAVFRNGFSRLRAGHAPESMAVVRHVATNLLRRAAPSTGLKSRGKRAGWNTACLESPIRQSA